MTDPAAAPSSSPEPEAPTLDNLDLPPDTDNPWEFLAWVQTLDLEHRHTYLDHPWFDLVSTRPPGERDALITHGKDVFKYSVVTARDRLKELARALEVRHRFRATVATEEFVAELVYRPESTPATGFLVHTFKNPDAVPEFVEQVTVGATVYRPPMSRLIEQGVITVPSGVEEYGTEAELFGAVHSLIEKHIKAESTFLKLAAAWTMYTWLADRFPLAVYLRLIGDLGTAKTAFEEVIGALCYRPILAAGAATASPLFRILERLMCTLILDEADHAAGRDDEWAMVLKILNTGIRAKHHVLRSERAREDDPYEPSAYSCFGPKIVASRELLRDAAFESRCLTYTTQLVTMDELGGRPVFLDEAFRQQAAHLQRQLLLWRFRRYRDVHADPRDRIPGVTEPRTLSMGLVVLAAIADPEVRQLITQQLVIYSEQLRESRQESFAGHVARVAIEAWLRATCPSDRLLVKPITAGVQLTRPEVSYQRVGAQLRTLGFETKVSGGDSYIVNPKRALFEKLAKAYGRDLEAEATAFGIPLRPKRTPVRGG